MQNYAVSEISERENALQKDYMKYPTMLTQLALGGKIMGDLFFCVYFSNF